MKKNVFEGIKIAEFAWVVVGPSSSRYLAEYGATVVKIESHKRLDTLRGSSPFANNIASPDSSMFFGRHNSNKYSVSIDLQHPNGKKLAWKLIEWADIMTESFSPRTMQKWGLGYEEVKKVRPDIIYLSSSMQGGGGPHSSYAGYGQNAVNLCGFTEISGWPDKMPAAPQGAYTDFVCCRFNALALIAALDYRKRTGKGQWIEQSQFESSLHFFAPPLMDYQINGKIMGRNGNKLPSAAPHGVFQCKGDDNWVAISVVTDEHWRKLCQVMGNPDLSNIKEFATLTARKSNERKLEILVTGWTLNQTPVEAEAILQKSGIPANIVEKPADVYQDPQLAYRHYFTSLDHSVMGKQKYEAQSCYILSKTPRQIKMPSPCLGEHNEYVFKELLKMSDDDIAEHIIDGSITTELPGTFKVTM
jgi:crotonobetainyl-CoA:carnitine CoA-transferase CaiB-like acyl-CoA transferase